MSALSTNTTNNSIERIAAKNFWTNIISEFHEHTDFQELYTAIERVSSTDDKDFANLIYSRLEICLNHLDQPRFFYGEVAQAKGLLTIRSRFNSFGQLVSFSTQRKDFESEYPDFIF
jgi:hypothetical protein